ncbi:PD-(D/E)XK nuclease family protein, partial [Natrinema sp. HArc-T2]|uniref:PD-(D/E)XK nuclease family protein n=1 Tax=Natrinema sp. HArc-T2 TaxID=3242701 RepID=UPI00359CDB5D
MAIDELTRRLDELRQQLDRLPETAEPPPTTLQLLGRNRQEGDWQRLLAYFLDPAAPHRLNHAALEQFLRGLQSRDDLSFQFSRFDLETVQVATEIPVPDGRVDLLVWCEEKWLILCELKIDAAEGDGQTRKYATAETFQNVDLDPAAVADSRRHYLFVTPDGSRPESEAFAALEWSWIASQLRAVLESDYGSYPVRTTSQLDDFVDTIETELTMTAHERNEAAKAELYVDYYDEVAEITSAFETEWEDLIDN